MLGCCEYPGVLLAVKTREDVHAFLDFTVVTTLLKTISYLVVASSETVVL